MNNQPLGKRDIAEAVVTTLLCAVATELFYFVRDVIKDKRQLAYNKKVEAQDRQQPSETYS